MMKTLRNFVSLIWSKIKITSNLAAENLALRQQLAVMKRTNKRPKIRMTDRLFWVLLSRIWIPWRKSLVIVKPDTVVRWHRKGFKLFWTFKSDHPMDSPAGRGGLAPGYGAQVFDAGSGFGLWRFLSQSSEKHGHQRSNIGPSKPLAKPVC